MFDDELRRNFHPRIPDSDRTSGTWRRGNMIRQMLRNNGWRRGREWYVISISIWY